MASIWKSLEQLLPGRARRSYRHRYRNNALCLDLAINHAQASILVLLNYSLYIFTPLVARARLSLAWQNARLLCNKICRFSNAIASPGTSLRAQCVSNAQAP